MRNGMICKSTHPPEPMDLTLINQYTRRELSQDEVFCFHVILCDNDIDRDDESFTVEALHGLKKLFLGKTGIFDHEPKGQNQTARIYDTMVTVDPKKQNQQGEDYTYLMAKAYAVRSEKNADFILEIDAGIKKEVSVGCRVNSIHCSICGEDWKKKSCHHTKGACYDGVRCYGVLEHPTDAYEWSFVAVPSQKNAGVIKRFLSASYLPTQHEWEQSEKREGHRQKEEWERKESVKNYVKALEKQAAFATKQMEKMRKRVKCFGGLSHQGISGDVMSSVVDKMDLDELIAFDEIYQLQYQGGQFFDQDEKELIHQQNNAFKMSRDTQRKEEKHGLL